MVNRTAMNQRMMTQHIVQLDDVIITQQRWLQIYLYLVSEPQQKGNTIVINCGATTNMVLHAKWFNTLSFRRIHPPHPVQFGDNTTAKVTGIGDVWISSEVGDRQYRVCLKDTLLVPTFQISLVSVSKLRKARYISAFDGDTGHMSQNHTTIMTAHGRKGLYHLQVPPLRMLAGALLSMDINVLHHQMGHTGMHQLKRMVTKGQIKDIKTLTRIPEFCKLCVMGKMKKLPFKHSEMITQALLDIVHSDVGGPVTPTLHDGYWYWVTFTNIWSRHPWVLFARHKSDVEKKYETWKTETQTFFRTELGIMHFSKGWSCFLITDGGGKYSRKEFEAKLKADRIFYQTTTLDTLESNGITECINQTRTSHHTTHSQGLLRDSSGLHSQIEEVLKESLISFTIAPFSLRSP